MRIEQIKENLEGKIIDYLKNNNRKYYKDSVKYNGIRENYIISDKGHKDYHFLSYEAVADKSNIYSTQSYFVFIEKVSEKISYILGPQSSEIIEE